MTPISNQCMVKVCVGFDVKRRAIQGGLLDVDVPTTATQYVVKLIEFQEVKAKDGGCEESSIEQHNIGGACSWSKTARQRVQTKSKCHPIRDVLGCCCRFKIKTRSKDE